MDTFLIVLYSFAIFILAWLLRPSTPIEVKFQESTSSDTPVKAAGRITMEEFKLRVAEGAEYQPPFGAYHEKVRLGERDHHWVLILQTKDCPPYYLPVSDELAQAWIEEFEIEQAIWHVKQYEWGPYGAYVNAEPCERERHENIVPSAQG